MSTVVKALQLLDLFSRSRPQIGLSDLARLAGLNKATCFRLVSDLCAAGLVEQMASGRDYRLAAASPAIDSALRLAEVRTDRMGVTRPQGTAPDAGAFERP